MTTHHQVRNSGRFGSPFRACRASSAPHHRRRGTRCLPACPRRLRRRILGGDHLDHHDHQTLQILHAAEHTARRHGHGCRHQWPDPRGPGVERSDVGDVYRVDDLQPDDHRFLGQRDGGFVRDGHRRPTQQLSGSTSSTSSTLPTSVTATSVRISQPVSGKCTGATASAAEPVAADSAGDAPGGFGGGSGASGSGSGGSSGGFGGGSVAVASEDASPVGSTSPSAPSRRSVGRPSSCRRPIREPMPTSSVTVTTTASTTVTIEQSASSSDLAVGKCVRSVGTASSTGAITAKHHRHQLTRRERLQHGIRRIRSRRRRGSDRCGAAGAPVVELARRPPEAVAQPREEASSGPDPLRPLRARSRKGQRSPWWTVAVVAVVLLVAGGHHLGGDAVRRDRSTDW